MGLAACHSKARSICGGNVKVHYAGLALINMQDILDAGSTVIDTREQFCGHASILIGYVPVANEATPAEMNSRLDYLKKSMRFYAIADATSEDWTGSEVM